MNKGSGETRQQGNKADTTIEMVQCRLNAMAEGDGLVEVMLTPWGSVASKVGAFVVDEESARLIEAAFAKEAKDLPIDYEHTTMAGEFATASGAAPAAGWITKVIAKPGQGIYGLVKWNDAARAMIRADEYRFVSPVLGVRKSDRKAVALHSAALTNKPAIWDMDRVAAKDSPEREVEPMSNTSTPGEHKPVIARAYKTLGISGEPPEDLALSLNKVAEAAEKKIADATADAQIVASVRKALSIKEDANETVILCALANIKTQRDQVTQQGDELKAMKDKMAERDADDLIAKHGKGKLNPNGTAEYALFKKLAKEDPAEFVKVMSERPALREGFSAPPPGEAGEGQEETMIAKAMQENKGNYGAAMTELQVRLKKPFLQQGMSDRSANEACALKYPKIFAV